MSEKHAHPVVRMLVHNVIVHPLLPLAHLFEGSKHPKLRDLSGLIFFAHEHTVPSR